MTRGFVIMAQNTANVKYTHCAKALEKSIKRVMPDANVTIITTSMLPHGDLAPKGDWKLINDWQVYEASPYDETIKLEADMYMPRSIEHWWDILSQKDVVVTYHAPNNIEIDAAMIAQNGSAQFFYYNGNIIHNADPRTFRSLKTIGYATDKYNKFFKGILVY